MAAANEVSDDQSLLLVGRNKKVKARRLSIAEGHGWRGRARR